MKGPILITALLLLSPSLARAEIALFDSQGFEAYPLGTMTSGQDGWGLAYVGGQNLPAVEDLNDGTHEQVLHAFCPSSGHGANYQSIGPLDWGLLKVSFDVKASTSTTRTLIFQVGHDPYSGSNPGSVAYIGWGAGTNMIQRLTTTGWTNLTGLDTNWHHVDFLLDLDARTYDFNFDGGEIEANDLPWIAALDLTTNPINRVLFTAWGKGAAAGDVSFLLDNVTISAVQVPEPTTGLLLLGALLAAVVVRQRSGVSPVT